MKVIMKEVYPDVFGELAIGDVFILPLIDYGESKIGIKTNKCNEECECFLDVKTGQLHNITQDCTVKRVRAELIIYTASLKAE